MADDCLSGTQAKGLQEVDGLAAGGLEARHGQDRFAVALDAVRACDGGTGGCGRSLT